MGHAHDVQQASNSYNSNLRQADHITLCSVDFAAAPYRCKRDRMLGYVRPFCMSISWREKSARSITEK